MKQCILFIFMLLSLHVQAKMINGQLVTGKNEPVPFASVVLLDQQDKIITGASTEDNGRFKIEIPDSHRGTIKMQITFIGFTTLHKDIVLGAGDINLGKIKFAEESERLTEARVTATATRATLKGDTTELNANAFKVNPDASAQDLIAKMPTVDVSGGSVKAQGEEVKKILVDGKEYFGTDVSAALANLQADMIDRVQIFDEQSEMSRFTGFNDGNTSKAINIVTKNGANKSITGRFFAGGGTDDRYKATASINQIDGNQRLAIMAQSNNVNEQNFSVADITGSSSSGQRGARGRGPGGGGGSEFMVSSANGITKTHAAGINFNDVWANKVKFTGSYFFNNGTNENAESTYRDYITEQTLGQVYTEQVASNSKNYDHRFNFRIEYQIDSANSLLITPRISFQNTSGESLLNSQLSDKGTPTNSNFNQYKNKTDGVSLNNSILYRHKLNSKQSVTLGFDQAYNTITGKNDQESRYNYFGNRADSIFVQHSDLDQSNWTLAGSVAFGQVLSKFSMLMAEYRLSYTLNDSDKQTGDLDTISGIYHLNKPLSNVFKSTYLTQNGGLSYVYNSKDLQLNARVSYQNSKLDNEQEFPYVYQLNQQFNSILPSARLRYTITKLKNLMVGYRTNASTPSISQLQNVVDNSNPLQLKAGNPLLKQNYQHSLFSRYSATSESGNSFFVMLMGRLSNSYIANRTIIAERDTVLTLNDGVTEVVMNKNTQLSLPENMTGYYSVSANATYGIPIKPIQSNLNINAAASYTRTPGIVSDVKNFVSQPNFGGGFTLSSNISKNVDFTWRSNVSYTIVKNSVQTKSDNNFYNIGNSFRANVILLDRLVFNSDVNHTLYSGLAASANQTYILWNASIGYKVFKNKTGEFKLSVFDLLKQNQSYARNTSNLYNEEVISKTLAQYFMLSFTYNLKHFIKKA